MQQRSKYAEDGVDVGEEAKFSQVAALVCKGSHLNSTFVQVEDLSEGNFRGPTPFTTRNLPVGYSLEPSADGIGKKGVLHDAAGTHHLAAYDLFAMTGSDVVRSGGKPLTLTNVLDVVAVGDEGSKENEIYKSIIFGLGKVARQVEVVLLKGETAQMGICIGSPIRHSKTKFNWSATMIGAYHSDKEITGSSLVPGQVVIALKEEGFRCNGITAVIAALRMKFGEKWWQNPNDSARSSILAAAEPSVLYDMFIATLHGWRHPQFIPKVKLHAVAHLSGGGIKEKFAKDILFPRGLSAVLDKLWRPPVIMRQCAKWRGILDDEFYETWNGGQGMLLVVDDGKDRERCLRIAAESGISAKVAGRITHYKTPRIEIHSKLTHGKRVIYTPEG